MKHSLLIATALLGAVGLPAADTAAVSSDTSSGFVRLKSLVGEWQAETSMGKARLTFELIAGGTALVSRESMDNMPPMMTVYYMDGGRLLLTHYCMVGNQPRMQASAFDPATQELKFRFLDATNLQSAADGHMHNASFQFIDSRHFKTAWEFYEGGHTKMTEAAEYTRVR